MDVLLLIFSSSFHDIKHVLTHFDASRSGWPAPIAFLIGGIQFSSMTYNGYGLIAAMSEEVNTPEKTIPKGMVYSVMMSAVTGLMFIIPILAVLPDLNRIVDENPDIFPIDLVFKLSTKSFIVSFFLAILIVGSVGFATIGSLTTASRAIYAFGRDHGLPYNHLWQTVDSTGDQDIVPRNALFLAVGVSIFLGSLSLISASAFNAFLGCSVVSLNMSYGIPILSSILNKRRKIRGAAFKLRKFGYIVNVLSCICILVTMIVLCMPPSRYININTMNYAIVVFLSFTILIAVGYYTWGKNHFKGPELDHQNSTENGFVALPITPTTDTPGQASSEMTLQNLGPTSPDESYVPKNAPNSVISTTTSDDSNLNDETNFQFDNDAVFVRQSDLPDDETTLFDTTSRRERSASIDFTEIERSTVSKKK
ncbi:unnamed protein product [Ambrosiozyma monospora]|uniref:Unnamed protein product n=1 Tax=Ambrosiozyma monospora TaxID=43982 RepID=A0A9W6YV70_AMBMO|nr:unnamed protein product [Ambrosiozyma monospora]